MKVPNEVAQAADVMAKETRLGFRDCLDILIRAYLQEMDESQSKVVQTQLRKQEAQVAVSCS